MVGHSRAPEHKFRVAEFTEPWECCRSFIVGSRGAEDGMTDEADQAALPCEAAATRERARTLRSDGFFPAPSSSQDSEAPKASEIFRSVPMSGSALRPDSSDAMVALERPAHLPNFAAERPDSSRRRLTRSVVFSTATDIATATGVVKTLPVAAIRVDGQDPRVRTLHERIVWIQDNCGPDGERLSLAQIAERAEISRQALSALDRRSQADPTKKLGKGDTLEKIASVWGVDLVWLVSGKGAPRKKKLSALETVLAEREWPEQAKAAARAEKRVFSAEQWRQLLTRVAAAFDAVDAPPKKNSHAPISAK